MFSFFGEISTNFELKNYGFDLYAKRKFFSWKKNGPNSPDFKEKTNSKLPDFYDKFQ